ASGVVTGEVAVGGAPGAHGTPQLVPLRDLEVDATGAAAWTDPTGAFTLAAPAGAPVTARYHGRAAAVTSATGGDAVATAPAGAGMKLALGTTTEDSLAQGTAFQGVTATRAFLIANGFPE